MLVYTIFSAIPLLAAAYGGMYDPYVLGEQNQGGIVEVKSNINDSSWVIK